jgi:hypothetical protein
MFEKTSAGAVETGDGQLTVFCSNGAAIETS